MKQIGFAGALCAAVLLLASCGDDGEDASEATTAVPDELTIEGAWVRSTPEVVNTAAVYMTLRSPVDDRLVAVEVDPDIAGAATMHETVTVPSGDESASTAEGDDHSEHEMDEMDGAVGGLTSMEQRSAIDLPAGESVDFSPGVLHIMLEELVDPLEAGETVDLELQFEEAGAQQVTIDVLDNAPE